MASDEMIYALISRAMDHKDILEKLKWALMIIRQPNDEVIEMFNLKKKQKKLAVWFDDLDLDRDINKRNAIIESGEKYYYYADDVGEDDQYLFKYELEKKMKEIETFILDIYSDILSKLDIKDVNIYRIGET